MLPSLSFQGTTKVVNKGVDVTIVANEKTIEAAMKASRSLVVRGMSTAVLEVTCTDPIDERTISHFVQSTGALVFADSFLYESAKRLIKPETFVEVCNISSERELIELVEKIVESKRLNHIK